MSKPEDRLLFELSSIIGVGPDMSKQAAEVVAEAAPADIAALELQEVMLMPQFMEGFTAAFEKRASTMRGTVANVVMKTAEHG